MRFAWTRGNCWTHNCKKGFPQVKNPAHDRVALNRQEETLLLLFRELSKHQRNELIGELMAMQEANRDIRPMLKRGKLDAVSNESVRAALGDSPQRRGEK